MFTQDELGLDAVSFYEQNASHYSTLANECESVGDVQGRADALLATGWAREKLGDGESGLRLAEEARLLLRSIGDLSQVAECCHTMAVWAFHSFDGTNSVTDFAEAAACRESIGELLLAAQSWHNMGYVQLIGGRGDEAEESYGRALVLLQQVEGGPDPTLAASAFRQRGFVLSHVAFTRSRFGTCREALEATVAYFEHTVNSGHHREPVLAYLAPGVALAATPDDPGVDAGVLAQMTGIPPEAELWLREAVNEASRALVSSTGSRRAYLGSHLLALTELGRWCAAHGHEVEGEMLAADAIARAEARGWSGEASRINRAIQSW